MDASPDTPPCNGTQILVSCTEANWVDSASNPNLLRRFTCPGKAIANIFSCRKIQYLCCACSRSLMPFLTRLQSQSRIYFKSNQRAKFCARFVSRSTLIESNPCNLMKMSLNPPSIFSDHNGSRIINHPNLLRMPRITWDKLFRALRKKAKDKQKETNFLHQLTTRNWW